MKALVFERDVPRYLASRALYRLRPGAWSPSWTSLCLRSLPAPMPESPGWTRLRVRRAGVCGSDTALLTGADSLYLEPEATYPFVPGHEIVGVVDALGPPTPGVEDERPVREGDRVAVWAPLGCRTRNLAPCLPCNAGWDGLCERRDGAWPDRGLSTGWNRDTGGGWAEACLAHRSQLWPLPPSVSDEDAVLLDPAATAAAALLRTENDLSAAGDAPRTLVVGGGPVGLLAVLLHGALGLRGTCEAVVRHPFQQRWAAGRGLVASVVRSESAFETWAREQGVGVTRVAGYGKVHRGVYDRVIVAAGSRQAVAWALRTVRPGGVVALVAAPVSMRLDPTPLWYREITVRGVYVYGPVPWEGAWRHPYGVLLPLLADGRLSFSGLVTHTFALGQYAEALTAAVGRSAGGAIKVTLKPRAE